MRSLVLVLALAGAAYASCPNACSGHGTCQSSRDACSCYDGWTSADCSERLCAFGSAWVDVPIGDLNHDNSLDGGFSDRSASVVPRGITAGESLNPQWRSTGYWERHPSQLYGTTADESNSLPFAVRSQEGHFYAECSGAGLCDRATGICDCFPPFGGSACNRTVCPNDCSGHGVCRSIAEALPSEIEYYNLWDAHKIHSCQCDGGWAGLDCAQRQCPRGDDPLTTTTTAVGKNAGLTEAGEIQQIDIRCPYNGEIVNGWVTLVFTDPATGDEYETEPLELAADTTEDDILSALKALPNGVLADYIVDGSVVETKLSSASLTPLETGNFWRLELTFASSYGDVPYVTARPARGFLCKNGVRIETDVTREVYENIATYVTGEGPRRSLRFEIQMLEYGPGTPDVARYRVMDLASQSVVALNDELEETTTRDHTMTDTTGSSDAVAFTDVADFSDEAAKVAFHFEYGANINSDRRFGKFVTPWGVANETNTTIYYVDYIVEPKVVTTGKTFTLATGADAAINGGQNVTASEFLQSEADPAEGDPLTWAQPAADPAYDFSISLTPVFLLGDDTDKTMKVFFNDELVGYGSGIVPERYQTGLDLLGAGNFPDATFRQRVPTLGATYVGEVTGAIPYATHNNATLRTERYTGWPGKEPITSSTASSDDRITLSYYRNEALNESLTLIIKYVSVSTSQDTYAWKVAGDASWQDNSGAGYDVIYNATALGGVDAYVAAHAGDSFRSQVKSLLISFEAGADNDARVCDGSLIYIHVGSDGLNDRPECSNRGICDYSSGLCQCFSGYTAPDCGTQSSLAAAVTASG